MKYKLILLKDDRNILVSDEKIYNVKGREDWNFCPNTNFIFKGYDESSDDEVFLGTKKKPLKIIAGIESLPLINYSDEVKQVLKTKYEWIDWKDSFDLDNSKFGAIAHSYYLGFKAHQSITNKKFSLEDMKCAYGQGMQNENIALRGDVYEVDFDKLIESLQQPIQLDVEIEMEEIPNASWGFSADEPKILGYKPKTTNNAILITKILE